MIYDISLRWRHVWVLRGVTRMFTQQLVQPNNKIKASHYCLFVRGIHRWPVYSPRKGPVIQKAFYVMILYLPIVLECLDLTPWHQCEALWKYWNQSRSLDLTGSHKNGVPKLVPSKWDRRKPVDVVKGLKCFTEKLGQSAHYAEKNYKTTQHSDVTWAWRRVMGFYILVYYFGGKLLPAWKSNHMPSKM